MSIDMLSSGETIRAAYSTLYEEGALQFFMWDARGHSIVMAGDAGMRHSIIQAWESLPRDTQGYFYITDGFGELIAGNSGLPQHEEIAVVSPWNDILQHRPVSEYLDRYDAFVQLIDDETITKVNDKADTDSPAVWLKTWADMVGPAEAGRVLLGS